MKRLICFLISAVLLLALVACAKDPQPTNPANPGSEITEPSKPEKQETDAPSKPVENTELAQVYKIVSHEIYMDAPNWQKIEEGYSDVFIIHGQKYVTVTGVLDSNNPSLEEAHDLAIKEFKVGIQNYSYVNELVVEKEEKTTINGIEAYRYEGKLNCGHDTVYDAYAVGYTFVMDGIACNIIGSVIDTEQPQQEIDAMRQLIDDMMKTVRGNE